MSTVKAMCESDSERIETIRRWHIDQAVGSNVTVALLNIAINMDGEISTKGLCIEPAHVPAMLAELQLLVRLFEGKRPGVLAPAAGACAKASAFATR